MGGNKGKASMNNNWSCYNCGESGHWVKDCHLKEVPCSKGCNYQMKLMWSSKETSYNCRFLKCPNPKCKAFNWVDLPYGCSSNKDSVGENSNSEINTDATQTSEKKSIKVTVEDKGKKITFEGEVDVVLDVLNKKFNV